MRLQVELGLRVYEMQSSVAELLPPKETSFLMSS